METVWKLKKTSINDAQELAEQLVIPVPVASVMIQRGIDTPELANDFFDLSPEKLHDPWLLPDINKVVDRLEKEGKARRIADGADRRVVLVEMTDEGRTWFAEIAKAHENEVNTLFSDLTEQDLDQLRTVIKIAERTNDDNPR